MSTPLTWIEGQARGRKIGFRRMMQALAPYTREHTVARQKANYAHRTMKCAERTNQHLQDCYDEIERLGGVIPEWPDNFVKHHQVSERRIKKEAD